MVSFPIQFDDSSDTMGRSLDELLILICRLELDQDCSVHISFQVRVGKLSI